MAALHASDSGATSPSNSSDSDTESSTTNYGHVDDEPYHLSYHKGELTWGSYKLKDEDIITVTGIKGSNVGHTIFSLVPTDAESQKPFELRTTNATLLPEAFLDKFLFRGLPPHLDPSINVQILISTLSGTGLSPAFYDDILHPLLKNIGLADSSYNVVRTKSAESVMEFARSTLLVGANEGKNQTVLMLSGDGGMVDTINGLLESGNKSRYLLSFNSQSLSDTCLVPTFHQSSLNCHWAPAMPSFTPSTSRARSLPSTFKVFELFYMALRNHFRYSKPNSPPVHDLSRTRDKMLHRCRMIRYTER